MTLAPPDVGRLDEHDQIHVWIIHADAVRLDELTPLLAADEVERAARFHFDRDRARFIVRRAHLRRLLGAYLDLDSASIRFAATGTGKPVLGWPATDLHFSVSQSGDIGVCAVGRDHPIGVDVERIRTGVVDTLASGVCTPNERAALTEIRPEVREAAFFTLWTHKEALVKADGRGLSLPVASIDVATALTDRKVDTRLPGTEGDTPYVSRTIALDGAFTAAVARRAQAVTVRSRAAVPTPGGRPQRRLRRT